MLNNYQFTDMYWARQVLYLVLSREFKTTRAHLDLLKLHVLTFILFIIYFVRNKNTYFVIITVCQLCL